MNEQTYPTRPQIISLFPTNKACLIIEDATALDDPKIRVAIIPAGDNTKPPVDFYINIHIARALFASLRTGQLQDAANKHNKERQPEGFDLYAKLPNGYRSLTIKNKPEGIAIRIIKNNGDSIHQAVYLSAFQTMTISYAVSAYIAALSPLDFVRNRNGKGNDPMEA